MSRLKDAWLVLTNDQANEVIGLACNLISSAAKSEEVSGTIKTFKNDGTEELFDYQLKPSEKKM